VWENGASLCTLKWTETGEAATPRSIDRRDIVSKHYFGDQYATGIGATIAGMKSPVYPALMGPARAHGLIDQSCSVKNRSDSGDDAALRSLWHGDALNS
jgi:hypothetical protein